jgi:hypothetical protein
MQIKLVYMKVLNGCTQMPFEMLLTYTTLSRFGQIHRP